MINRFLSFLVLILFFLLLPSKLFAQTDTGWVIDNFDSQITVNQDTSVNVKERIDVDFGNLEKHGIFRTIPVKYRTASNNNLDIRFKLLGVTDDKGQKLQVSESKEGNNVKLKIGDPDVLVTGKNTYIIDYAVNRVITTPNDQAEFYWNVTGNAWPVPILNTKLVVTTPEGSIIKTICFTGIVGSTSQNCSMATKENKATFSSGELSYQEGLTISVLLNKNKFTFPTKAQQIIWFLQNNLIYLTPLFVFLFMLQLYWRKGRDKEFKNIISEEGSEVVPLFKRLNPVMAFEPPKDISPGEVGVLVDEKVNNRDITAIVIDLARRGYFKIKETPKKGLFGKAEYTFILTGKDESNLNDFEKSVLDMIFGESRDKMAKLNKLHKDAYKFLQDVKNDLYKDLVDKGYFEANPQSTRTKYFVAGIIVMFLTFYTSWIMIPTGLIILAFAPFMPARTPKGRKALEEIAGLKEYLRVGAWREKIYEKHNFFEEALPFTIVFGMTDKFIKAFKAADIKNLDWYQSSGTINAIAFNNSINSINSSVVSAAAATAPRSAASGGSGFSGGGGGGGFGGGGGGSW